MNNKKKYFINNLTLKIYKIYYKLIIDDRKRLQ